MKGLLQPILGYPSCTQCEMQFMTTIILTWNVLKL